MKNIIINSILTVLFSIVSYANTKEINSDKKDKIKTNVQNLNTHEHDQVHDSEHKHDKHEHEKEDGHEHEHEHEHDKEHNEHADKHRNEDNPQVGPNKGILEFSDEFGFKLSTEAEKNFEIQKIKILDATKQEISKEAIVTAGLEVNLYRYRSGFYKRIDFEQLQKTGKKILIRSKDLKVGDEIVISGLGFLRIVEIAASGGAPEGHSH